jgi:hypothetical protein
MILPVAKLGTLLLKTMSKPIATRLKTEASRHPKFRQLIINLAQVPLQFPPPPFAPCGTSLRLKTGFGGRAGFEVLSCVFV